MVTERLRKVGMKSVQFFQDRSPSFLQDSSSLRVPCIQTLTNIVLRKELLVRSGNMQKRHVRGRLLVSADHSLNESRVWSGTYCIT